MPTTSTTLCMLAVAAFCLGSIQPCIQVMNLRLFLGAKAAVHCRRGISPDVYGELWPETGVHGTGLQQWAVSTTSRQEKPTAPWHLSTRSWCPRTEPAGRHCGRLCTDCLEAVNGAPLARCGTHPMGDSQPDMYAKDRNSSWRKLKMR